MAVLTAEGSFQSAILNYINSLNAPELMKKIADGEKNIADCCSYIISEMRKKAKNNVTVAENQEVFGLAVHYFEEDSIKKCSSSVSNARVFCATSPKKEEKPKAAAVQKTNNLEGQMSLFDL